ncbi:MAG: hypothetical protein R2764_15065 [Bacteroidales bacterium]
MDALVDSPKHMFREDYNINVSAAEPIYEDDDRNIALTGMVQKEFFPRVFILRLYPTTRNG